MVFVVLGVQAFLGTFFHTNGGQFVFRYKLEPFDKEWIKASGERNGVYTNLPPGKYKFILQTGVDGKYNDTLLTKEIIIEAAWWQTLWGADAMGERGERGGLWWHAPWRGR